MIQACLLDKAICQLGCELDNRPAWLKTPLQGVLHQLGVAIPG